MKQVQASNIGRRPNTRRRHNTRMTPEAKKDRNAALFALSLFCLGFMAIPSENSQTTTNVVTASTQEP